MSSCPICLDILKAPVALPCGHVYCDGCILGTVKAAASTSSPTIHCPTCREPVSTVTPDPSFIPPHLRPYVLPSFRRIYLNTPAPSLALADTGRGSDLTADSGVEKAVARLHMENAVLRQSCYAWHARAHTHMTAHFRLSALMRQARDQARMFMYERDEIARKYESLKRKFSDVDRELESEIKPNQEGRVFIWAPQARDEAEANIHVRPEEAPCVTSPELQGGSKRPRLSPTSLFSEVPTKPATSIPAMVIPHLVSHHQTASSPRSLIFDT